MTRNTEERANSSSLREDLDAGRGRDKVPFPDPAAAPLGTDDEAAGTPVTEEQLRMARRHEIRGEGGTETAAPAVVHGRETHNLDGDPTLQPPQEETNGFRIAIGAIVLLILMALVVILI
jgi:hypothetical protein